MIIPYYYVTIDHFYTMQIYGSHKYKLLHIRKKHFLTLILFLFGVGSYTYSEITEHPINHNNINNKSSKWKNTIAFNVPIYYNTPTIKIAEEVKVVKEVIPPSESVMDKGNIHPQTLAKFLTNNNSTVDSKYALRLAKIYIDEATHEGVNPDLAFTQMCLETGFLRFDGTVDRKQNNFCGLGVTGGGVKGHSFPTAEEGVRAHIQHLKAYGSTQNLNKELVDQRFKFVRRGSGVNLSDLTGKWATDRKYDKKIRSLLNRLYKMSEFNSGNNS